MEGLDRTAAGALLTDILDLAGNLGGYPVPQANVRTYSGLGLQSAGAALWLVSMSAAGTLPRGVDLSSIMSVSIGISHNDEYLHRQFCPYCCA